MNIRNCKRFLKHAYKKTLNGKKTPIMFNGPTGVGKTAVIYEVADEIRVELDLPDFRTINYRLSQKEQGDLIGNPNPVELVPCPYCVENGVDKYHQELLHEKKNILGHIHKMHEKEFKGKKLPSYEDIMELIRSKYHYLIEIRTGYAVPYDLPTAGHGILHLDELNRALKQVRDAVFELVWDRSLGRYKLPPGWMVVSSVNPPSDEYIVYELDEAMIARYCHIRFTPEHGEWMSYAARKGLYDPVRQFVSEYPNFLGNDVIDCSYKPKSCPRTLDMMGDLLDGIDEDLVYEVASGCIGVEAATAYMSMQNNKERPIPAKKILEDYKKVQNTVKKYANKNKNRADLLRVSIDDMLVLFSKREEDLTENEKHNTFLFIKDIPKDLAVGFIKMMATSDSEEVQNHFRNLSALEELRVFMQKEYNNVAIG